MLKLGRGWLVAAAALVVVAIGLSVAYQCQRAPAEPRTQGGATAGVQHPATAPGAARLPKPAFAAAGTAHSTASAGEVAALPPRGAAGTRGSRPAAVRDEQITLLNEHLDADNRSAILAQARKMVASPKVDVRAAALEALRWLGGREVVSDLVGLLSDADPEIADDAADGLVNALEEADDPFFAASVLEQAIRRVPPDGTAEGLLLSLSGLPEEASVPALLNLLEERSERLSDLAREYLEFVTGGEEISSRAQGEAWLREKAKADAGRETN